MIQQFYFRVHGWKTEQNLYLKKKNNWNIFTIAKTWTLAHVGVPNTDGSWWRVLTKCGPLEKGMANHVSILALRTPWTVWKGKKIWHWKTCPPGWQVSSMLLGKSGGQSLVATERTKWLGQSRNSAQLWMYLVVKVKSKAVKNNTA